MEHVNALAFFPSHFYAFAYVLSSSRRQRFRAWIKDVGLGVIWFARGKRRDARRIPFRIWIGSGKFWFRLTVGGRLRRPRIRLGIVAIGIGRRIRVVHRKGRRRHRIGRVLRCAHVPFSSLSISPGGATRFLMELAEGIEPPTL